LLNYTASTSEKNEVVFSASPKNPHKKFRDLSQKNIGNDSQCSNIDKVLEHFKNKSKTSHNAMDGIELLMMDHAKTIKIFSARRQAIAKNKIAKLIGELELEQIDEDTTTSSSSQSSHYSIPSVTPTSPTPSIIRNYDNADNLDAMYYQL
jgi:hypothetical protein